MDQLRRGTVIIGNWHVLQPQAGNQVGRDSARVVDRGEESDTALVKRVLGRRVGGKQNILVFNDEAHHAYRLRPLPGDAEVQDQLWTDEEAEEAQAKEATVWVQGLDKIHRVRGINFCVDLSATPYYLNNTGNDPGRPFPWVVSDFGLVDAIECGMVKIPQLPIQDSTGAEIPAYFNVWKWIVEKKLTAAEKGGKRGQISPKAVLKYAQTPIAQLAGLWRETFAAWRQDPAAHPTPPVFIVVCRDTRLARVMYDETIGKPRWPNDRPPEEWLDIAEKLGADPFVPPGRDIRCIISVAMLTEGWDATTVTHIDGQYGRWAYRVVHQPSEVPGAVRSAAEELAH